MRGPNAFLKLPESSFALHHIIHREKIGADEQGHLPLLDKRCAGTSELGLFILRKCESLLWTACQQQSS